MLTIDHVPTVRVEMLIRKPAHEVFEAFVDPAITSKFWFTKGSGRLVAGKRIRWDWEMYGASTEVDVKAIEASKRILIEWGSDEKSTVEWIFRSRGEDTLVTITNNGFVGDGEKVVAEALDATEGFTIVLCGLKALLEQNVRLNLIGDKAPDAHVQQ